MAIYRDEQTKWRLVWFSPSIAVIWHHGEVWCYSISNGAFWKDIDHG